MLGALLPEMNLGALELYCDDSSVAHCVSHVQCPLFCSVGPGTATTAPKIVPLPWLARPILLPHL